MIIENKRIHDLIVAKDLLVNEGRKLSGEMEKLERKIAQFEEKERVITAKVDVKELQDKGEILNNECQKKFEELQRIIKQIEDVRLSHIPEDMKNEHLGLMKEREKMERDRNKIFLKVQKIKDKVVPIIQKEVKPLLGQYDDIETAKTRDGKVIISTFNRLDEWKAKFGK